LKPLAPTGVAGGSGKNWFRGQLSEADFQGSEANLIEFVKARSNSKPHLINLM
jgi:hypothetical protein